VKCPKCTCIDDRVLESRTLQQGQITRRRRECLECKFRFTSYERVEEIPLTVVKKDGGRVPFNRDKIITGLIRAFVKRPVELNGLEKLAMEIERELKAIGPVEISTDDIGKMIMKKLLKIDQVAYIRFASVYRKFEDVKEFIKEVNKLSTSTKGGLKHE